MTVTMVRSLYFVHPKVHDVESFLNYVHISELPQGLCLEWNDRNPELLFASEVIYSDKKSSETFRRLYCEAKVVVYYGGEASFTDFNIFDYGVGFDHTLKNQKYAQILSPIDFFDNFFYPDRTNLSEKVAREKIRSGLKFCNFLYSNPVAHPYRDNLFYKLSEYKKVDALGRHLNNTGIGGTGFAGHARESVNLKENYKFSIASENCGFQGYTSEKILTSLQAHTVPIYWGDPDVDLVVNPKCFINCNDFDTLDEVLQKVKEIDNNDDLWCEMVSQPWFTEKQLEERIRRNKNYHKFMLSLLCKSIDSLTTRPNGTFQYVYRAWFLNASVRNDILYRLKRKMNFRRLRNFSLSQNRKN